MKSGGYHGRFLARSDPDLMNPGPPMLYDFDRPAEVFPGPGFQPFIMAVAPHEPKVGKEPLKTGQEKHATRLIMNIGGVGLYLFNGPFCVDKDFFLSSPDLPSAPIA